MSDIYAIVEHRQGSIRDVTWELLGQARQLAEGSGGQVVAVVLGQGLGPFVTRLARSAHRVVSIEDPRLEPFNAAAYQRALVPLLSSARPALTLLGHTAYGADLAPALACQLRLPLMTDCVAVASVDGRLVATRQLYVGKIEASVTPLTTGPAMVTMRPGSAPAAATDLTGSEETFGGGLDLDTASRRFLGFVEAAVADVDITQSEIVVAVGRGLKEPDNLPLIEELARSLGAVVAGSRPVVDAGWLPKSRQVGSSGKTVKPKLYVAIGISGSFQHVVGMKGAGTIVAINKDPRAPIFSLADLGIVGDLHKVVPSLTAKVKALKV